MANESTTTSLNDLLPSIVTEALFVAQERSLMRGLVRNYTLPAGSGKTVTVPIYPAQTAAAVNEATDLSNTSISTSGAVLTVGEVGIMTTVTDLARVTSASNVVADVGRLFGEAVATKMDKDLTALFSGFSASVGGTSTTLTAAIVAQGIHKLRAAGVPLMDSAVVLHPDVGYDFVANLTNTFANPNAGVLQNEAMQNGFVGRFMGVPVFITANIANNGTAGDYVGAVFHRDALGLAMLQDIKIETQRDASLRADELVATAVYGVGELYDGYGIGIVADSTIV
jgi:HK97 family phage major capsid protein